MASRDAITTTSNIRRFEEQVSKKFEENYRAWANNPSSYEWHKQLDTLCKASKVEIENNLNYTDFLILVDRFNLNNKSDRRMPIGDVFYYITRGICDELLNKYPDLKERYRDR